MEVKLDKNRNLIIKHKLLRNETYKVNSKGKFNSVNIYKKPQVLKGVSSYCSDGKHVIFLDYDNVPLWLVEQDYKNLQRRYLLPPAYLFTTGEKKENGDVFGNYHVICLVKVTPGIAYDIISQTHCDINFMSMPLRNKYRNWILRTSDKRRKDKPTYLRTIGENKNLDIEVFTAHLKFLNLLYKLTKINYENEDGQTKIFTQVYEAS